ncbi:MAG TPA: FlgO family outer membrane protein [Blastocatellia bacterium]|nr:FlgO family outer membrane protein [Blastocatellia bacterium]
MKSPRQCYEFGPFRLDPTERQLLRLGQVLPLTPKVFDTLLLFLENSNLLLTKDEMIARLWPDSFVEEGNLAQNVSVLRRALGEQQNGKPYIETVPKRGYRFIAEVRLCEEEARVTRGELAFAPVGGEQAGEYERRASEAAELTRAPAGPPFEFEEAPQPAPNGAAPSITPPATAAAGRRKRGVMWAAIAMLIIAAGGAYHLFRSMSQRSGGAHRLAVLPFHNLGPDSSDDFLGFSLADAVITKLNYISALTVRPSAYIQKYGKGHLDPKQVAAELNVDKLLTGTFLKEGDDLRINLQLVDVTANQVLWSESLNLKREKLTTIQDRVTQEVIRRLSVSLTPAESAQLQRGAPRDPQAYEYHLRGVDLYWKDDLPTAGKMLEESVALDPNYALSWAYLGTVYTTFGSLHFGGQESYDKAQRAYDRALALDPAQIEARIYLAAFLTDTGRVEQAVPLLRGVLQTNPNLAQAHWEMAYAYRFGGLLQESINEGERSRQINNEIKANNSVFNSYLYDGQYDKFLQSLPAGEPSAFVTFYRGLGNYYQRNWKQAAANFDQAYQLNPALMPAQAGKALSYGLAGQPAAGLDLLKNTEKKIVQSGVADAEGIYKIAQAFAALNDRQTALRLLRRAVEGGFFCYPYFTNDPLLNNLRGEAEFARLMELARRRHEEFKRRFSAP